MRLFDLFWKKTDVLPEGVEEETDGEDLELYSGMR